MRKPLYADNDARGREVGGEPVASGCCARRQRAFTLIEIMMVIGILAIVMTMSVPAIYRVVKREGLRKAVADIVEVCSHARAQAILQSSTVEVVFRPLEGTVSVSGAAVTGDRSGRSAQLPENVTLEMLDINFVEYREQEEARARFFPNGMCDELTIILRSDQGEFRMITFEITTGLASVEADPSKWR